MPKVLGVNREITSEMIKDGVIKSVDMTTSVAASLLPAGVVLPFGGTNLPIGFLWCNGQSYSRTDYASLYAAIGSGHGALDINSFNVPDLRGRFIRGVDGGGTAARDPDRNVRSAPKTGQLANGNTGDTVGSVQADDFRVHTHTYINNQDPRGQSNSGTGGDPAKKTFVTQSTGAMGGNETRPLNLNLNYIIKT